MPGPTGVAGQINTAGKIPGPAQTGLKYRKLMFAQLRCLVYGDDVVFLTLIAQHIPVGGAVAEKDSRAAGK